MRSYIFFLALLSLSFCKSGEENEPGSRSWTETDRAYLVASLDSTLKVVLNEISSLDNSQWNWKPAPDKWSAALVVEHLITHDELFYREVRVLSGLPEPQPVPDSLFADDEDLLTYGEITEQNIGNSPAYLEPLGRWCSKDEAIMGYSRVRNALINFVKSTDQDLRKYYTRSGRGPTLYRDLHQLLLVSIAHTARHHKQIRNIKDEADWPESTPTLQK